MNIFGIGPLIVISGVVTAAAILAFEHFTGCSLSLPAAWYKWAFWAGMALLVTGLYFWISSAILVKRAFQSHQLVQRGVYGLSRNPMYAGFIVFIVPGLALTLNDLLLAGTSMSMFIIFKMRVRREEEYLLNEFGESYERYRKTVTQLIPFIRI